MINLRKALFSTPADIEKGGLTYEWKKNGEGLHLTQSGDSVQEVFCTNPYASGTKLATSHPSSIIGPASWTEPGKEGIYTLKSPEMK